MVEIVSDRADIENHVSRLVDLIKSNGGYVHDDLIVESENGNLALKAPRSVDEKSKLIFVPRDLLLPKSDFDLYLSGDDICIGASANPVSSAQLATADEMLAIYNLCEKIKIHRETAPVRLFIEAPETFEALVLPNQFRTRKTLTVKDPILDDFLHTRLFAAKAASGDETQSVLMPIIDFLNHNRKAGGYQMSAAGLLVNRHSPLADTDECFVTYSRMDAQTAFAIYGFVDENSDIVTSIPLSIDLPGVGTIEVNRQHGTRSQANVPPALKNIAWLVPQMNISQEHNQGRLGCLIIPPEGFPRSMRRILSFIIRPLAGSVSLEELNALVLEAERQVIKANLSYYDGVKNVARKASVPQEVQSIVDDAGRMAVIQLNLIRAYVAMMEQMDSAPAQIGGN